MVLPAGWPQQKLSTDVSVDALINRELVGKQPSAPGAVGEGWATGGATDSCHCFCLSLELLKQWFVFKGLNMLPWE